MGPTSLPRRLDVLSVNRRPPDCSNKWTAGSILEDILLFGNSKYKHSLGQSCLAYATGSWEVRGLGQGQSAQPKYGLQKGGREMWEHAVGLDRG